MNAEELAAVEISDERLAKLISDSEGYCDCKPQSGCSRRVTEQALRELQRHRASVQRQREAK